MEINTVGFIAAFSTFLSVWFGHVAVRRIESVSPSIWLPAGIFAMVGILLEWLSLSTSNHALSTLFGVLGMTLLFDALEFSRQQNRIRKGHAPANPHSPRHARLMHEHAAVSTLDLLKRDPIGKPVSHKEAVRLILEHEIPERKS